MSSRTQPILKRKRGNPIIHGGEDSYKMTDCNYCCPICFDMLEEPYMTKCGHSFCYTCIVKSLELNSRCPKCCFIVEKKDEIFPNFLLAELVTKHKEEAKKPKTNALDGSIENLDASQLENLLQILNNKKLSLQQKKTEEKKELLKYFLQKAFDKKTRELSVLNEQLNYLKHDLLLVQTTNLPEQQPQTTESLAVVPASSSYIPTPSASTTPQTSKIQPPLDNEGDTCFNSWTSSDLRSCMGAQHMRLEYNFEEMLQLYFETKTLHKEPEEVKKEEETEENCTNPPPASALPPPSPPSSSSSSSSLYEFSESLNKFMRFSSFRVLSSFNYHSDLSNTISIVSSIEFDKDLEYFAIAGVTKKIKVFEYASVTKEVEQHYPVCDMVCSSKLSSVVWNSYHKNLLASSNYDGVVCLWDVCLASKIRVFQEHEKRCWTVDFNKVDPYLLASGSDDSSVKIWHTNTNHSVTSLKSKANICGVKFNPESLSHLAFGSADHCIHYYDLRNVKQPLMILKGHKRAVSYAKFINNKTLVSASTDSQLKLWDVNEGKCLKTYQGHSNERNFVGLAADDDYIACGSENNSIYVYCKDFSQYMLSYKFESMHGLLQNEKSGDEDRKNFVGAVCWRSNSNVVLAANSQGNVKVLEMV